MSNHRGKFLFDTVFDPAGKAPAAPEKPQPLFTEDDLVAARREGQEAGFQMGLEQARRQHEAQLAAAMSAAAETLSGLGAAMQGGLETIKGDAAQLALAIAGRLAPALIERQPLAELSRMVAECLSQMPTEPRVVVRVAEPLVDSLQAQIDELGRAAGFAGQLVLIGEPDMAAGDARVEWADGGAERNLDALMAEIEAAVDRYRRGQHELAEARKAPAAIAPAPIADDEFDAALPALSGDGAAQQRTEGS